MARVGTDARPWHRARVTSTCSYLEPRHRSLLMKRRQFLRLMGTALGTMTAWAGFALARGRATAAPPCSDKHTAGYGKCSRCSCERYDARGLTCRCGHSFYQHHV